MLEIVHNPLLHALADAAIAKSRTGQCQLDPQSIANTAWAIAAMEWRHMPLMAALAASSLPTMPDWTPCELSSTAWSYARLGWRHLPLMHATATQSHAQLAQF